MTTSNEHSKTLGFDMPDEESLADITDVLDELMLSLLSEEEKKSKDFLIVREHQDSIAQIPKMVLDGYSVKDIVQISDGDLEKIYDRALQLYNNGKYDLALGLFQKLGQIDPINPRFIIAVGAAHQMLEDYTSANECYMIVAHLSPQDPLPHHYATECYIKLGDIDSALVSLELLISIAKGQKKYVQLREHSIVLRNALRKKALKHKKKKKHKKKQHQDRGETK
jgi:type III secretion system low calcium response chaperone LcrH/SycD